MATIRQPVDSQPLVEPELRFIGTRTWLNFFRLVARLLEGLREVPVIATADVTPAAAATADGVPTALTITTADAGATYVALTQTLINEIKADLNTHFTEFNALVTQFDALVVSVNAINTQLTATIALVNEIKASQNAQSIALNS